MGYQADWSRPYIQSHAKSLLRPNDWVFVVIFKQITEPRIFAWLCPFVHLHIKEYFSIRLYFDVSDELIVNNIMMMMLISPTIVNLKGNIYNRPVAYCLVTTNSIVISLTSFTIIAPIIKLFQRTNTPVSSPNDDCYRNLYQQSEHRRSWWTNRVTVQILTHTCWSMV